MAERGDIRTKVNRGLAWMSLAQVLVGALDLISTVVVLLWLSPHTYGVAMLAGSLFAVLDLLTDLGLSAAVIQRDDHTPARISTVFWLNVALSLLTLLTLGLLAPLLGQLQGEEVVGAILIAYGGKLVFQNVYFIPQAMMKKELRFKELSFIRLAANFAEAAGKIVAAALGAGVWFHFIGRSCHTLVTAFGIQWRHPWRPRLILRVRESLGYITFGLKASASQILFHTYTNIDYQIVGYFFGPAANGFYHLAYTIVLEPVRLVSNIVIDIAFPTFARLRHTTERLKGQFITFTRLNLITVLPVLAGLFLIADDLIMLCWGQEWQPAAAATKILCLAGVLRALSFVMPPLLDGVGRPSLTLVYMITAAISLTSGFVAFAAFLGDRLGFLAVAWAWAAGYPIAFVVLLVIVLSILDLEIAVYLRRVVGIPLCVAASGIVAGLLQWALASAPTVIRFIAVTGGFLAGVAILLARFQGITVASLRKALKDDR
ncbi:MAG: oligosaccharide flippase family protein [Proteobacteria bacterium]|nr:oligosaccharide flippase family protein [Pseudomonadota bacterium]